MNRPVMTMTMFDRLAYNVLFHERLRVYYASDEWQTIRVNKLNEAKNKSEISGGTAEHIHHLSYPKDLILGENWGTETTNQLMVLTKEEHEVTHELFQDISKNRIQLTSALKEYFSIN